MKSCNKTFEIGDTFESPRSLQTILSHLIELIFQVPAPTLSRTPAIPQMSEPEPEMGENTIEILQAIGYSADEIKSMQANGAVESTKAQSKL